MRVLLSAIAVVVLAVCGMYLAGDRLASRFFAPTDSDVPIVRTHAALEPEVLVTALQVPWEIAFLPDGSVLVTERVGRLLKIGANTDVIEVEGVAHRGEGGLLGLALHPQFEKNQLLYLYMTSETAAGLTNRVERYRLDGATLTDRAIIIEGIPGARTHDGGRIAFGPDGFLYIATGDAGSPQRAQDMSSLAGKILRVTDDGDIPRENRSGSAVYSIGHRNVQGLAWDLRGQLWATEHGRSGAASGFDEVNRIEAGANYGWPEIQGDEQQSGMRAPAAHSGPVETWAPSGMTVYGDTLLFAGLRGEALYALDVEGSRLVNLRRMLVGDYGRIRTVARGPDGMLYLLTSNRDGRGAPDDTDDRIIRIDPAALGLSMVR